MALDSVPCGPVYMGYPDSPWWFHPTPNLSLLHHFFRANAMRSKEDGFSSWQKSRVPKSRNGTNNPRMDQMIGWTGPHPEELKNTQSSWQQFPYQPNGKHPSADYTMTSSMTKNRPFTMQPTKEETAAAGDVKMTSSVMNNPGTVTYDLKEEIRAPADVNMTLALTSIRERSRSAGSWGSLGMNQPPNGYSVARGGFYGDEPTISEDDPEGRRSGALLEARHRDLMNFWASEQWKLHQKEEDIKNCNSLSKSHSFSSSSSSTGSEYVIPRNSTVDLQQRFKARFQEVRERYSDLPIDMTCRKRKSKVLNKVTVDEKSIRSINNNTVVNEPIADRLLIDSNEQSILRSMLTERGRSYSMSALEMRRRRLTNSTSGLTVNLKGPAALLLQTNISTERQRVTLAKKNLLPVSARITDLLGRIVNFATSLPEFTGLSQTDQDTLLSSSCMRLLLLSMAEINLQFATAFVLNDSGISSGTGGEEEQPVEEVVPPKGTEQSKEPTVQFAHSVQNFIRKCQTLNVTKDEYFHMKLITLFHSGVGPLECTRTVTKINSSAREDLQDLVSRSHPTEKLRYSTLLLSLHTLFGIHCGMLQSLFCQHLDRTGGIRAFVLDALSSRTIAN